MEKSLLHYTAELGLVNAVAFYFISLIPQDGDQDNGYDREVLDAPYILRFAILNGHLRLLDNLLKTKFCDINKGLYNKTPLMLASKIGQYDAAQLLLHYGADTRICNVIQEQTALSLAAKAVKLNIVDLLLGYIDLSNELDLKHWLRALCITVRGSMYADHPIRKDGVRIKVLEKLLQFPQDLNLLQKKLVSTKCSRALMPLISAVTADRDYMNLNEKLAIINLLCKYFPQLIHKTWERPYTALQMAIIYRQDKKVIEALISCGSDVNLIIKPINPKSEEIYDGYTPLMQTAKNRSKLTSALLVKYGSSVDYLFENEFTALMYAAEKGLLGNIEILLTLAANVNLENSKGVSALSCAADARKMGCLDLLLEMGAIINNKILADFNRYSQKVQDKLLQHVEKEKPFNDAYEEKCSITQTTQGTNQAIAGTFLTLFAKINKPLSIAVYYFQLAQKGPAFCKMVQKKLQQQTTNEFANIALLLLKINRRSICPYIDASILSNVDKALLQQFLAHALNTQAITLPEKASYMKLFQRGSCPINSHH